MKSERISLWLSLLANFGVLVGLALLVISVGLALRGAGSFSADRVLQLRLASQANFGRG